MISSCLWRKMFLLLVTGKKSSEETVVHCQTPSSMYYCSHLQCIAVLKEKKYNVLFTTFFSTPPDIIDNSKLITEECRKKVNRKHTSCLFVVQTTGFTPWLYCMLIYTVLQDKSSFQILEALRAFLLTVRYPITNRSEQKYFYSW